MAGFAIIDSDILTSLAATQPLESPKDTLGWAYTLQKEYERYSNQIVYMGTGWITNNGGIGGSLKASYTKRITLDI